MKGATRIYRAIVPQHIRNEIGLLRGKSHSKNANLEKALKLYKAHGLFFVHIPKAAGVSVFQALYGEDSWGHEPLTAFLDTFGRREIYSIPRACIVRNPYLRLHSGYKYLKHGGRGKGSDLKWQEILRPYDTFEKFVKEYLISGDALEITHFKSQAYWVVDRRGKLRMDYVGRFEDIDNSYVEMVKLFNLSAGQLPRLNQTKNYSRSQNDESSILNLFDQEMLSIINDVYSIDFELFQYKKKIG